MNDQEAKKLDLTPGKYAVLSISDTGHGIDPSLLNKIFDPYFTTKTPGKGTGLGLSVVYGIVKEHGEGIQVHRQADRGTRFDVMFPIRIGDRDVGPIADIAATRKSGTGHILLVEDEKPVLRFEKKMLTRLGYTVEAHNTSPEALEAFTADPGAFDLVMTDMAMPHMTGDQLAKEVMTIRPYIPVVICSGFSERLNSEEAAAMGIKGLLMKPVGHADMARAIETVLAGGTLLDDGSNEGG